MRQGVLRLNRAQKIGDNPPLVLLDPVDTVDEQDCRPAGAELDQNLDLGLVPQTECIGVRAPRHALQSVGFEKQNWTGRHGALGVAL